MDELKKLRLAIKTKDTQIERLLQENYILETKLESAEKIKRMAIDNISEKAISSIESLLSKELVEMEYDDEDSL